MVCHPRQALARLKRTFWQLKAHRPHASFQRQKVFSAFQIHISPNHLIARSPNHPNSPDKSDLWGSVAGFLRAARLTHSSFALTFT
jgi:hypothetical protein